MSMEFKSYESKSAGKLLGLTKIRHLWKLKVNGQFYEIKLAESLISSKFVVAVQNDIVFNEKVSSDLKKKGVSVRADDLELQFKNNGKAMDLYVNMIKFVSNSTNGPTNRDHDNAFGNEPQSAKMPARKSDDKAKNVKNDMIEGSWAQFDAMSDSDDNEENPFGNFESKQPKTNKPGLDKDPFGANSNNAHSKVNITSKPTEQKNMGFKLKQGNSKIPPVNFSQQQDPFMNNNQSSPDGWNTQANKRQEPQNETWNKVPDEEEDNDGFLNFGSGSNVQPQRPNLLPNFPTKGSLNQGVKMTNKDSFGFDPQPSQGIKPDAFGINPSVSQKQPTRASGFDAFSGSSPNTNSVSHQKAFNFQQGSNPSNSKQTNQPTQNKPADAFSVWGKPQVPANNQSQSNQLTGNNNPFGEFGVTQTPKQQPLLTKQSSANELFEFQSSPENKPQPPTQQPMNNMWSNFQVQPQTKQQQVPVSQQQPNAFSNQGWGQPQKQVQPTQQKPLQAQANPTNNNPFGSFQSQQSFGQIQAPTQNAFNNFQVQPQQQPRQPVPVQQKPTQQINQFQAQPIQPIQQNPFGGGQQSQHQQGQQRNVALQSQQPQQQQSQQPQNIIQQQTQEAFVPQSNWNDNFNIQQDIQPVQPAQHNFEEVPTIEHNPFNAQPSSTQYQDNQFNLGFQESLQKMEVHQNTLEVVHHSTEPEKQLEIIQNQIQEGEGPVHFEESVPQPGPFGQMQQTQNLNEQFNVMGFGNQEIQHNNQELI